MADAAGAFYALADGDWWFGRFGGLPLFIIIPEMVAMIDRQRSARLKQPSAAVLDS
jgi:hypothetical protein